MSNGPIAELVKLRAGGAVGCYKFLDGARSGMQLASIMFGRLAIKGAILGFSLV